ncbi:MAG: hypothetical protein DMG39_13910 [Acidobacteria bacterium]|nr:MAG: hypothetical protein DMG39_13910 [Acidobacteriota bacterium]
MRSFPIQGDVRRREAEGKLGTAILVAESDGVEVRDNRVSISQVGIFADGIMRPLLEIRFPIPQCLRASE